jgi:hypothetical protein
MPVTRAPVPPQRDGEPQDPRSAVYLAGGVLGGAAQVCVISLQPVIPAALLGAEQMPGGPFGDGQVMRAMRRAARGCLVTGFGQALGGVQPDSLQQPVAPLLHRRRLYHDEALVH